MRVKRYLVTASILTIALMASGCAGKKAEEDLSFPSDTFENSDIEINIPDTIKTEGIGNDGKHYVLTTPKDDEQDAEGGYSDDDYVYEIDGNDYMVPEEEAVFDDEEDDDGEPEELSEAVEEEIVVTGVATGSLGGANIYQVYTGEEILAGENEATEYIIYDEALGEELMGYLDVTAGIYKVQITADVVEDSNGQKVITAVKKHVP